MPEFRQNPLTGEWVIIAPERAARPNAMPTSDRPRPSASAEPCPFCPGHERQTPPEVFAYRFDRSQPDTPGWAVRVFPNKFPAATPDARDVPTPESIAFAAKTVPEGRSASTVPDSIQPGIGQHEVVVESPAHDVSFTGHSDDHARLVLDALRHRCRMILHARDVRFLTVIQNHGTAAGATISHPHFQILATAVIPPRCHTMLQRLQEFSRESGRSLFDVMLEEELKRGRRIVAANDEFVAFAPPASQFPYETWIVPREPAPFLGEIADDALPLLAGLMRDVLRRLERRLSGPDYNLVIHSGPRLLQAAEHFRTFIQIIPRITGLGGFELGSGLFLNPVSPEQAAEELRTAS